MYLPKQLVGAPMFEGVSYLELEKLFSQIEFSNLKYNKGETFFNQGDSCKHLYFLIKGKVSAEMYNSAGGILSIANIFSPNPLAPAYIFATINKYPVTVKALTECEALRIPKINILKLMSLSPQFLERFIVFNSDITKFLSDRLQILSIKTIRGKVANHLLEYKSDTITLNRSITQLANYFGVTRPALSKCLSEMAKDGCFIILSNKQLKLNLDLLIREAF